MAETMAKAWEGFVGGAWEKTIDVRDFIQKNYTPYEGDESFLAGPTESTTKLWSEVMDLFQKERENGGVLDIFAMRPHVLPRWTDENDLYDRIWE